MPIRARLLTVTALACLTAASSAPADGASDRFTVKSSLAGLSTLPVRLHWQTTPVAAPAPVTQALFQIDGKARTRGSSTTRRTPTVTTAAGS
jgi:hypothetical protein